VICGRPLSPRALWARCSLLGALALAVSPAPAHAGGPGADCPAGRSVAEVHRLIDAAETAYVEMSDDPAPFGLAVSEAAQAWSCLDEPMRPGLAARAHRIKGLHRIVNGDDDAARRAFAAARALEPTFRFPDSIQPADPAEPFNLIYFGMPADPTPRAAPPPIDPKAGALWFDGSKGVDRPVDRPTLAQHIDAEGVVRRTEYLRMDQAMFDYPVLQVKDRKAAWATGGVGLGLLAVAGGSGIYYASIIKRGGCETADGAYTCNNISTSTAEFDQTFVRPTKIVGYTALGLGGALLATSGLLFAVDSTGASLGLHGRW
jgi:hypothetical protein